MILLDKSLKGTDVENYIQERSNYWDVVRQLTRNELVESMASAYLGLEIFADKNDSLKNLEQHLKQVIEQRYPSFNMSILPIVAEKIVCEDVLARLNGQPYFNSYDYVEQLSWIQRSKLIEKIRERDGYRVVKEEKKKPVEEKPESKLLTHIVRYFKNPFGVEKQ